MDHEQITQPPREPIPIESTDPAIGLSFLDDFEITLSVGLPVFGRPMPQPPLPPNRQQRRANRKRR